LSILTKICVVALVLLNLAAAVVFINMAVVYPNYRYYYQQEQVRAKVYAQTARASELATQVAISERNAALQAITAKANQHRTDLSRLASQLAEIRQDQVKLTTDRDAAQAQQKILASALHENVKRQSLLDGQLRDLRGKIARANQEKSGMADALQKARDDFEKQQMIARAHGVRIQDLLAANRELEKKLEDLSVRGTKPTGPERTQVSPDITGTILAVRDDRAKISIGAAQGIKAGMKLIIHRGPKLVGHFRVELVEADTAAGFIYDKVLDPRQGDKVMSDTTLRKYE